MGTNTYPSCLWQNRLCPDSTCNYVCKGAFQQQNFTFTTLFQFKKILTFSLNVIATYTVDRYLYFPGFKPQHDKTNKMSVRPVKTQISLGIRPVWSESSLCAQWEAKDLSFLHADSEDSDQTGWMPRLIWVFAGRTVSLLVLSCRGSCLFLFTTKFAFFQSTVGVLTAFSRQCFKINTNYIK